MRMWHYELLRYLPDMQLKGQLRELVAIMHNWRDKGIPKNMLVNLVTEYPVNDFYAYFTLYMRTYYDRFGKGFDSKYHQELVEFCKTKPSFTLNSLIYDFNNIYKGWHTKEYLRICMANLYEKHRYSFMGGKGTVDISDWQRLCEGYKYITGEEYKI